MKPRLVIHPRADLDVLEIHDYLLARSRQAAVKFLDAVSEARRRIAANPSVGAAFPRSGHEDQEWRFLILRPLETSYSTGVRSRKRS